MDYLCSDHTNVVSSCAFSNNYLYLATASWDKAIYLYDIMCGSYRLTGPTKLEHHEGCINFCSFSLDGKP